MVTLRSIGYYDIDSFALFPYNPAMAYNEARPTNRESAELFLRRLSEEDGQYFEDHNYYRRCASEESRKTNYLRGAYKPRPEDFEDTPLQVPKPPKTVSVETGRGFRKSHK